MSARIVGPANAMAVLFWGFPSTTKVEGRALVTVNVAGAGQVTISSSNNTNKRTPEAESLYYPMHKDALQVCLEVKLSEWAAAYEPRIHQVSSRLLLIQQLSKGSQDQ